MTVRRWPALVAALSLFVGPVRAAAQDGATLVAIVTAEPTAPLTRRVQSELRALGVDVVVLKPPSEASAARAPLERAARSVGAVAAVRLVVSGEGKVEVWVADRVTGKALVRELDAPGSKASDAEVAVSAVELLRASLMELHASEPPHGEIRASEKVKSLALPAAPLPWTPRGSLAVGAGVELGLGGLGPSAMVDVGGWLRIGNRFGMRVVGQSSIAPLRVGTEAGAITLQAQSFGAMATYDLVDPSSRWIPSLSLGASALHVSTTGVAVPPYVSATADHWGAAPTVGVGLACTLARGVRLRGDGRSAWALPSPRIRTPNAAVGTWGAPSLSLSFGVEVLWGT